MFVSAFDDNWLLKHMPGRPEKMLNGINPPDCLYIRLFFGSRIDFENDNSYHRIQ